VSDAAIALIAAFVGATVSLLGTFLSRLQDRFSSRIGAMEVVRSELQSALKKVKTTTCGGNIWPAGFPLRSRAWESHHAELASNLRRDTLRALQERIDLLEAADGWAEEVRSLDDAEEEKKKFREWLPTLETELSEAISVLDDALSYSRSRYRRGLGFATALTLGLAVVAVLVVFPSGSSTTSTSLARDLQDNIPGVSRSICEESANLDGAYQCAIEISPCHGQLEASTNPPSCAQSKTVHIGVDTSDACYYYEFTKGSGNGRSPPEQSGGLIRKLTDWVCKKR
jgi:hypothetical protein